MAEINVDVKNDSSGNTVRLRSNGRGDLPPGAGQPITQTKDTSGKAITTSGQIPNSSVVFNNPG